MKLAEFSVKNSLEKLEGLRTDLEILIKSEFGSLLTSTALGLDLVESIKRKKIRNYSTK